MRNIQELQDYFYKGRKSNELFSVPSEIIINTPQTSIEKQEGDLAKCKHASPCSEITNAPTMRNIQELQDYFYKVCKKTQAPSEIIIKTQQTIKETIVSKHEDDLAKCEKASQCSEIMKTPRMRNMEELQEYFYKGRNKSELLPVPSEITITTPQTSEETIIDEHEDNQAQGKHASPYSEIVSACLNRLRQTHSRREIKKLVNLFCKIESHNRNQYSDSSQIPSEITITTSHAKKENNTSNNNTVSIPDKTRSKSSDSKKRMNDTDFVIHCPKHKEYHDDCKYSNGQQHFISVEKPAPMSSCCAVTEAETETICSSHNDEVNDRSCFSAMSAISFDEYIFDVHVELEENVCLNGVDYSSNELVNNISSESRPRSRRRELHPVALWQTHSRR